MTGAGLLKTPGDELPLDRPPGPPEDAPDAGAGRGLVLAVATMVANLVAVAFTVIFTRLLGAEGYGSLAALVNLTIILFVPAMALQVAAAREGALGRLGSGGELAATLARWTRALFLLFAGVVLVSVLVRAPLAALLNVRQEWAAAAVPPTAVLYLVVCIQRGLLLSTRGYRVVGASIILEGLGRLAAGAVLVGLGLGVSGAYLGTLGSFVITVAALGIVLRRRLGPPAAGTPRHPLRDLARDALAPIVALTAIAALQNVDVIAAKHALAEGAAGVYAATTVAAKAVVWIAVGLGLYVLPETTRRHAEGHDARSVLVRALALIGFIAAAALTAFALFPELLLRIAFGARYEGGADVLLPLGAAFALLAATYLAVQFKLGLRHRGFIAVLVVAALVEPLLLTQADGLESFARTVLAVQAVTAAALLALSLLRPPDPAPAPEATVPG